MEVLVVLKVLEVADIDQRRDGGLIFRTLKMAPFVPLFIANHQNEVVGPFAISLVEDVRSNEGLTAAERVTSSDIPSRHLRSKSITYT
ncbi:hypothetical protein Tco_1074757 [Tanacetum coccineum]